jgi:hypothetical protein
VTRYGSGPFQSPSTFEWPPEAAESVPVRSPLERRRHILEWWAEDKDADSGPARARTTSPDHVDYRLIGDDSAALSRSGSTGSPRRPHEGAAA